MKTPTSATGKARSGVTLLELLVVVVLIGILAGAIVPRMSRSISRVELQEAAARFAHTTRTARQLAVAQRQPWGVEVDLDHGGYGVVAGQAGQPAQGIRASWLKSEHWPKAVRSVQCRTPDGAIIASGTSQVLFKPDGTSEGMTLRLEGESGAYLVLVQPHSGHTAVVEPGQSVLSDQVDLGD